VLGPCPVTIGFNSWPTKFFFAGGGGNYCDVISFHTYNSHMGDLALGRRSWASWETILSDYGLQDKPRAITEAAAFFGAEYGAGSFMRQASFTMLDLLLAEQHKVQKEDWFYFYSKDRGYDRFPSWLVMGQAPYPAVACLLTHTQELIGTTYEAVLDFGTIDNDYVIGSRYRRANSTGVVSMMAPGKRSHPVTLQITGGSPTSLVTVDCWGNMGTVSVSAGLATVNVGGLPMYVRLPAGVTATPVGTGSRYGARRETGATATCTTGSAGSTLISSLVDGTRPNRLFWSQSNSLQTADSVWQSGSAFTSVSPQTVTVTLASPHSIGKVIVESPPAWQAALTAIRSATLEVRVDGVWTQVGTISESPTVLNVLSTKQDAINGYYESFDDETHKWEIDFDPDVASAVRLIVSSVTYGGVPTLTAYNAYGELNYAGAAVHAGQGTATPALALSRISVFDTPQTSEATTVDFRLLESGEVRMNENGVDPARITGDAAPTEVALTVRIDPDDLRNALGL